MKKKAYRLGMGLFMATAGSYAGWNFLTHQQQADVLGSARSVRSSMQAFKVLGQTVYNYQMGLKDLEKDS